MLTIKIDVGNAAFRDEQDRLDLSAVAFEMQRVLHRLEGMPPAELTHGGRNFCDGNGNASIHVQLSRGDI